MTGTYYNTTGSNDWSAAGQAPDTSSSNTKAARDFRNYMVVEPVVATDPQTGKQTTLPYVKSVTLTIHNLSGGLNRVWGVARQPSPYYPYSDLDRTQAESLDTSYLGQAVLPLQSIAETAGNANLAGLPNATVSSCMALGALVVGFGKIANQSLLSTKNAAPALSNHTYTPGSEIISLTYAVVGGATQTRRLIVGMTTNVPDVISALGAAPTVDGTMNAALNPLWGCVISPLNPGTPGATTLLMYANNNIYSYDTTTALNAAPTSALSNVPNGGYAVSDKPIEVPGVPPRAYWVWPTANVANIRAWQVTSDSVQGQLVSTNLEGTDPQIIDLPIFVTWAVPLGRSIVVSDGIRVIKWEGTSGWSDLKLFEQRTPNSDLRYQCLGLGNFKGDLYAYTCTNNITATTATQALERYSPNPDSWHQVSTNIAMTVQQNIGVTSSLYTWINLWVPPTAGNGLPFDQLASQVHLPKYDNGGGNFFYRKFVPPASSSPFFLYNNTTGSGATTGQVTESSGSATSPALLLEGLEGLPFVVEEVQGMMDVAAGGSDAKVKIDIARQSLTDSTFNFTNNLSSTFSGTDPMSEMIDHDHYLDNTDFATRLQYRLTVTQGSGSTRQTSNGLPFRLKLLVFLDHKVRSPREVRG